MIKAIRILPPFAIGRFGSAETPMDNYTLDDDPDQPLGYRTLQPQPTFRIDAETGEISDSFVPEKLVFKERGRIRPVAPFLEVFADTDEGLVPLTADMVADGKVEWRARVANRKVHRRTGDPGDIVSAETGWFSAHDIRPLSGTCPNFVAGGSIAFGSVRFIKPNAAFPQIRLRFMPPKGYIYGPDNHDPDDDGGRNPVDPSRAIYDHTKSWYHFEYEDSQGEVRRSPESGELTELFTETVPPSLYAIVPPAPSWLHNNTAISRGYLDDACDGFVDVRLTQGDTVLEASARICVGPPDIAPDALFLRSLSDDLEQVLHGPGTPQEDAATTRGRALDTVRRAFETVRFMNLAVMNGNDFKGRSALTLDSMPQEESADTERAIRPVVPPETVDTMVIAGLHEQVYAAIQAGAAPWFVDLMRKPDEVTDFSDFGRRKMPAMMCGADNAYLALTWRQIETIRAAALAGPLPDAAKPEKAGLTPRNKTAHEQAAALTAQLNYEAAGNPVSSRPVATVGNCCPGLEVDFRAIWRRMFEGVELREYDNFITGCDRSKLPDGTPDLTGHRLQRVVIPATGDVFGFTGKLTGPAPSDPSNMILLTTSANPNGLAPLEWSNALAPILDGHQGKVVWCDFTPEPAHYYEPVDPDALLRVSLKVQPFFEEDTALISRALAEAGELTQGLCSPWQNDYRECSCYYWASARPDYVNVEMATDGLSRGDNWLQKRRTGSYVPDDYEDSRLIHYDDLFMEWERLLRFQLGGRDAEGEDTGA